MSKIHIRVSPDLKRIIKKEANEKGITEGSVIADKFADKLPFLSIRKIQPRKNEQQKR